jgi:hypothetical protein
VDKSFPESLANFFAGTIPSSHWDIGQGKLLYDQSGDLNGFGRFILIATARDTTSQPPRAWITIGATAVDYPGNTATDCTYALDVNLNAANHYWADGLQLGMTDDALVISGDMRAFDQNGTFQFAKIWVIPKQSFYNVPNHFCPPTNFSFHYWKRLTHPNGALASEVIPAKSYARNSPVTYLVSAHASGGTGLTLWALDSENLSLSPPTKVPVRPYSVPPGAPQKGTTQLINTGDTRLVNAVYFRRSGLDNPLALSIDAAECLADPLLLLGDLIQSRHSVPS